MKRRDIDDLLVIRGAADWWDRRDQGTLCVGARLVGMGIPSKLAVAKIEHLVSRGMLEYGVSPWFAWPTPKGRAALAEGVERP